MSARDKLFGLLGLLIAVAGIISTLFWNVEAGIVALLLLSALIGLLILLQRRQLAKLQQRMLVLLSADKFRNKSGAKQSIDTQEWKKVLGLLNAQQISMEILSEQVRKLAHPEE